MCVSVFFFVDKERGCCKERERKVVGVVSILCLCVVRRRRKGSLLEQERCAFGSIFCLYVRCGKQELGIGENVVGFMLKCGQTQYPRVEGSLIRS